MSFLLKLFGSQAIAPQYIPTDVIIPVFKRDEDMPNSSISLEVTMRFDSVLDADALHTALWKLLERPGWRKLGARLRRNDSGKLEYHVPAQYTLDRPPVNFSHSIEALKLSQHPISTLLPNTTEKLEVFGRPGDDRILTDAQSDTTLLKHWTHSDKAALGLHVWSFEDGTLVTICWLHTLMDALGFKELLKAWQAVLEGREADVPEFIGFDSDALAELGTPHDGTKSNESKVNGDKESESKFEEYVLRDKVISKLAMVRFVFSYLWELFWYPVEEGRMLFIPSSYFSAIKASAFADLDSLPKDKITYNTNSPSEPFLSDGDILTAWSMRLLASTDPRIYNSHPSRTLALINVFSMRELLRDTEPKLLDKQGAYVHNCTTGIWSHFTVQEFLSIPLGHVAARIRSDIVTQSTRAQIEAAKRLSREKGPPLLGSGDMALSTMTNWGKANLYDTNFSAAIVGKKGEEIRGKPTYLHPYVITARGMSVRGSASIVGRDESGNWWWGALLRKETIPGFVRAVEGMA